MWEADEPALSQHDLTGLLLHWIELGQPDEKRLVRVCGRSKKVTVYSYSSTAPTWWMGLAGKFARVNNLTVWQIPVAQSQALGALAGTVDGSARHAAGGRVLFVGEGVRSAEITPVRLFGGE
jgi:uncharacterized protein YaeQ